MDKIQWSSSCGRIVLEMTREQAEGAHHQGQCDDDVRALSQEPDIAAQLAALKPEDVARDLKDYGAWDAVELADHEQNLQRLLWCAAGDITEGNV